MSTLSDAIEKLNVELFEARKERDAYRARFENVIDAHAEGGWQARAIDAEEDRDLYRAALRCERCKGTTIAWDEWRQILCPDCKEAREKARGDGI